MVFGTLWATVLASAQVEFTFCRGIGYSVFDTLDEYHGIRIIMPFGCGCGYGYGLLGFELVFRKDIVFLVDISSSMQGKPHEIAKSALSSSLSNLNPEDPFSIIAFNGETYLFSSSLEPETKETIEKAIEWINMNFIAGSGRNGTTGSQAGGHMKPALSLGTSDIVFPQQVEYGGQPMAWIPYPHGVSYFGGMWAAYGRQAIPYLHESRHLHALKRVRGSDGRFVNTKKMEESNDQNASNAGFRQRGHENRTGSEHLQSEVSNAFASATSCSNVNSVSTGDADLLRQSDLRGFGKGDDIGGRFRKEGGSGGEFEGGSRRGGGFGRGGGGGGGNV
ncbi:hypothetical protein GIB67_021169 [Kingdonia uniflora]|uniref:Nuclear transcription factor Y subunit n=1 Tax=Kingdonia uniflora TaxID=39325 RepID=A0A7J7N7L9_9MAGN|nr:hypothetical protein GIB67_021169 [Kingdonia uniflora]